MDVKLSGLQNLNVYGKLVVVRTVDGYVTIGLVTSSDPTRLVVDPVWSTDLMYIVRDKIASIMIVD